MGVGATGYINKNRYTNIKSIIHYNNLIEKNDFETVRKSNQESLIDQKINELILGLRTINGISLLDEYFSQLEFLEKHYIKQNNRVKVKSEYYFTINELLVKKIEELEKIIETQK